MIAILDACVLYPASLRDLLLTLAALDAFDPRWSDEIVDEVTRNVTADYPDVDRSRFKAHTIASMRRAFPEATVEVPIRLVAEMDNDPKDRHVAAAAVQAGAALIVTDNVGDFEGERLRKAGVEVITPGTLVERLLDDTPEVVIMAIQQLSSRWVNPPRSYDEIVELLGAHPSMAGAVDTLRRLASGLLHCCGVAA